MEEFKAPRHLLTRRRLLQLSGVSSMGLLLSSCGTGLLSESVGKLTEPLNLKVGELLLKPQTPVPEFPISAIEPNALLINSFNGTPQIDPDKFRLIIDGEVNQPMQLSMADIQKLPFNSMVIRHICVEGWAAIVQWGGVRLSDLIKLAQPKSQVRYAYFESADTYYESWDIASTLHPQTLLAYQKNGQSLSPENGAPLRLASPIKLGYKQSKWVTRVTLTSTLSSRKGYWIDEGYEWFGGI
ncbi:oxidoreductase [Nostoc sp. MBR 210]|uniref:Molybdopterin-dependent oxidoreductase n=1 Tax=Nostoc spongiaeforme FACHB-130 TaxID=1357510 RepID=A0ABR8FWA7_9NOSO|nr:molybdopterin-dependent oxidoreductase [Nostoc spongiaeforme]MBD2594625.1 molybdopterin-dependent oxidoreductase [Nostoc spongiaeforme FACHB-130]OCQ97390.1 oxidoreductase [Nostoc sp. MBR 210]